MVALAGGTTYRRSLRMLVCVEPRHVGRQLQFHLMDEGHTVKCVFKGQDALDHLKSQRFSGAILSDVLPDMSGYEVLKQIREYEPIGDLWVGMMVKNEKGRCLFEQRPFQPNIFLEAEDIPILKL